MSAEREHVTADQMYDRISFNEAIGILEDMGKIPAYYIENDHGAQVHCVFDDRHKSGDRTPSAYIKANVNGDLLYRCFGCMCHTEPGYMLEVKRALGLHKMAYARMGGNWDWLGDTKQEDVPPGQPGTELIETHLPAWFWTETTDTIRKVKQWADSRMFSADALLGSVLTYVAAWTPFNILTPDVGKGPGSLNYFALVLGRSGESKSEVIVNGREFLGVSFGSPAERNAVIRAKLSTGQGLIRNYGVFSKDDVETNIGIPVSNRPVFQQTIFSRMFISDEGNELFAEARRQGSTVLETMRTAWSGHELVEDYAGEDKRSYLPRNGYRMTALMGIQYEAAQNFFRKDQASGGTPQRFLWLPARPAADNWDEDATTPKPIGWQPLPRHVFEQTPQLQFMAFTIEDSVKKIYRDAIKANFIANMRGNELDFNLDGHAMYTQLKTACLFAHLDNRPHVTSSDWDMASELMKVSYATRAGAEGYAAEQEREVKRAKQAEAVRLERAKILVHEDDEFRERVKKAAMRIITIVEKMGDEGATRNKINKDMGRVRSLLDEALDMATSRGWIILEGTRYKLGDSRPAD